MSLASNIAADLKARWKWPAGRSDLAEPAAGFSFAADLVAGLERQRSDLSRNGDLTSSGQARAVRAWVVADNRRTGLIAALGRTADAGPSIAAERAELAKPKIDRGDIVAELQRREIRDALRKLSPAKQIAAALEDLAIAEAVLSAPAFLTASMPGDARGRIAEAFAQRQHAERLGQLNDLEEAVGLTRQVLDLALGQIEAASGLDQATFVAWWTTGREPDALPPAGQMSRAAFDALAAPERMAKARRGVVLVDGPA